MSRIAINETWYKDSNCWLEAEGYQWPDPSLEDPIPDPLTYEDWTATGGIVFERNGGIFVRRRGEYEDDTRLVRFVRCRSSEAKHRPDLLDSPWWITEDWFTVLLSRARENGNLRRTARNNLALPRDWNAAEAILFARPKPGVRLAAVVGIGRKAAGKGDKGVFPIAPEAPHTWVEQCYVPGLGRKPWLGINRTPSQAAAWLQVEKAVDVASYGLNRR